MIDSNDEFLVRRCQQGDSLAFNELVNKYKLRSFRIAFNFVHNVEDAKELSQDAFVKVFRSISQFQHKSSFYTWFYRILVNLCLDFRKKKRLAQIPFSQMEKRNESTGSVAFDRIEDRAINNPLHTLLAGELNIHIEAAIDLLSDKQKAVFILRHYEHFSIKEIADCINSSEGTVKSHLARAVKKLQESLGQIILPEASSECKGAGHE